jgi:hypothetical protein
MTNNKSGENELGQRDLKLPDQLRDIGMASSSCWHLKQTLKKRQFV